MLPHFRDCPKKIECGAVVPYWQVHCRCGEFLGFPNYRAATAEREELMKRYEAAKDDCGKRGVTTLFSKIDDLAERSRPVIAMSIAVCDDVLRLGKYRNYEKRTQSSERDPASAENHSDRVMVGTKLFPTYNEHIHYAALSPDGRGLLSYGPIAVCWEVTPVYLERRASLHDENSYFLYDRYNLGQRGSKMPPGHRSTWEDRAKLVAAKVLPSLTTATDESDLLPLLIQPGRTVKEDSFVEIAIYAEDGLDTKDVSKVTLLRATTPAEVYRMQLVRETCSARGIAVIE